MHELSITQSILDQALAVANENKAQKIKKIKLKVGEGTAIVPDCVQFYFDSIKKDTIAEKSILEIEIIPVKFRCPKCKKEIISPGLSLRGSVTTEAISKGKKSTINCNHQNNETFIFGCDCKKGVEIVSGQEMLIEYIDVE